MANPKRFIIIGTSSSGKTTLAKELSNRLDIPHRELDSFYWMADWKPVERETFKKKVEEFVSQKHWVADGNFESLAGDIVWPKATHMVWLDYSLPLVLKQFLSRSIRRSFDGEELWNGNKETLKNSIFSRHSLLVWILKTYRSNRKKFLELKTSKKYPNIEFIHLKNPGDALELLKRVGEI